MTSCLASQRRTATAFWPWGQSACWALAAGWKSSCQPRNDRVACVLRAYSSAGNTRRCFPVSSQTSSYSSIIMAKGRAQFGELTPSSGSSLKVWPARGHLRKENIRFEVCLFHFSFVQSVKYLWFVFEQGLLFLVRASTHKLNSGPQKSCAKKLLFHTFTSFFFFFWRAQ